MSVSRACRQYTIAYYNTSQLPAGNTAICLACLQYTIVYYKTSRLPAGVRYLTVIQCYNAIRLSAEPVGSILQYTTIHHGYQPAIRLSAGPVCSILQYTTIHRGYQPAIWLSAWSVCSMLYQLSVVYYSIPQYIAATSRQYGYQPGLSVVHCNSILQTGPADSRISAGWQP